MSIFHGAQATTRHHSLLRLLVLPLSRQRRIEDLGRRTLVLLRANNRAKDVLYFAQNQMPIRSFSSSKTHADDSGDFKSDYLHRHNKQRARVLLEQSLHPPGSFTSSLFQSAVRILDSFQRNRQADTETVNLSFELLERLVIEMSVTNITVDSQAKHMLCEPRFYNELLKVWREAAKRGQKVFSPEHVMNKFQTMARKHPDFRYDLATMGMILDVAMKQAYRYEAPLVGKAMLDAIKKEAALTRNADLRPNVFLYNQVLQAWAKSNLTESPQNMDKLIQEMRAEGVAPNVVSYNILIRYWAGKGAMDRVETIMETMEAEGVKRDVLTLSQALYGYAKVGKMKEAEALLKLMIAQRQPSNLEHSRLVAEATQDFLYAYREVVDSDFATPKDKDRAVQSAENLLREIADGVVLNYKNTSKFCKRAKTYDYLLLEGR